MNNAVDWAPIVWFYIQDYVMFAIGFVIVIKAVKVIWEA